jgi:hypothetical protein
MGRLFVCDNAGWVTAEIETSGPILGDALEHDQAESVVRCAMLMAVSALAEGGVWPAALLQAMAGFMRCMKDDVCSQRLM